MMQSLQVITAPTIEPLSLAEARQHLLVEGTDQDALIGDLIKVARERVETDTRRALLTQTLRMTLDRFPGGGVTGEAILVPRPPLQSVTSIQYVDTAGATQTLSASLYLVDTYSEPGRIVPAYNQIWPSTRDVPNAVTVTFVAGWTSTAVMPAAARQLCRIWAAHYYEERQAIITGTIATPTPLAIVPLTAQLSYGDYR